MDIDTIPDAPRGWNLAADTIALIRGLQSHLDHHAQVLRDRWDRKPRWWREDTSEADSVDAWIETLAELAATLDAMDLTPDI